MAETTSCRVMPLLLTGYCLWLVGCIEGLTAKEMTEKEFDTLNGDTATQIDTMNEKSDSDTETNSDSDAHTLDGGLDGGDLDGGLLPPDIRLLCPPLLFSPTTDGFSLNAVVQQPDYRYLVDMQYRLSDDVIWQTAGNRQDVGEDIIEWTTTGLIPGYNYEHRLVTDLDGNEPEVLYTGEVMTQRLPGDTFSFAIITDTHIPARDHTLESMDYAAITLSTVAENLASNLRFDFLMNLGDVLDFHQFGFNSPPTDGTWTRAGYISYRRFLGDVIGNAPHFMTIGNWDGETGCFTEEEINRSREQRLLYMPGPEPGTYPESGGSNGDYYAFTWGDAFFMVLNVMTYTPTCHALSQDPGLPDDWTLGEEQLMWVEETLSSVTAKWRFIMIHHTVGGAAADPVNSAYGRGGGQAAYVGEQAQLHALMMAHGVQIFFYGHDHVFTDMVVDGIHYTLPGSAGAPWLFETSITGYPSGTYFTQSGYATVDVNPDQVLVQFRNQVGDLLDAYLLDG